MTNLTVDYSFSRSVSYAAWLYMDDIPNDFDAGVLELTTEDLLYGIARQSREAGSSFLNLLQYSDEDIRRFETELLDSKLSITKQDDIVLCFNSCTLGPLIAFSQINLLLHPQLKKVFQAARNISQIHSKPELTASTLFGACLLCNNATALSFVQSGGLDTSSVFDQLQIQTSESVKAKVADNEDNSWNIETVAELVASNEDKWSREQPIPYTSCSTENTQRIILQAIANSMADERPYVASAYLLESLLLERELCDMYNCVTTTKTRLEKIRGQHDTLTGKYDPIEFKGVPCSTQFVNCIAIGLALGASIGLKHYSEELLLLGTICSLSHDETWRHRLGEFVDIDTEHLQSQILAQHGRTEFAEGVIEGCYDIHWFELLVIKAYISGNSYRKPISARIRSAFRGLFKK